MYWYVCVVWLSKSKIGFRIRFCTPKVGKYIIYPLFCRFTVFGHLGMGISVLNFHEKRLHRISKFWAEILHVILYHGLEPTWKVTDGSDENKDFRGLRDRPTDHGLLGYLRPHSSECDVMSCGLISFWGHSKIMTFVNN